MSTKRTSLSSIYLRNKSAYYVPDKIRNGDITPRNIPLGTEDNHEHPVFDQFDELAKPPKLQSVDGDSISDKESEEGTADIVPHFVTTFNCGHGMHTDDTTASGSRSKIQITSNHTSAHNLHSKHPECDRKTKVTAKSEETINDLNELSLTSFDNFKNDSGIQSNLDVSDLLPDSSLRKMEMCTKFCTEVNLQLIQYRNRNVSQNNSNCPMRNYPTKHALELQTLEDVETENEICYSDYESTRNSDFEYHSTEFVDSDNESNYQKTPLKTKSYSQHGEITIEKESNLVSRQVSSNVLKMEIISKNQEIKELKLKLNIETEKNKEITHQLNKGEKTINTIQASSTAEIRHLRHELKTLRKERESLRQELSNKTMEARQRKAFDRRKSLQDHTVQKLHELGTKRDKVLESKSILTLREDIKRKEKELNQRQKTIHKLECEKNYLGEEIYRITGVEESFWVDEQLPSPCLSQKEKCLVRKNSTLNTKVSSLQKHCITLSKENLNLKNKMEVGVERPLMKKEHDKIRLFELQKLKKKNTELSTITKKLEEKVKTLEKKSRHSPTVDRRFPVVGQNNEKDKEISYQRQIQQRDLEIKRMKIRMRELVKKLTGKNGEITRAQSTQELEHIMRVVTKERLQLERHLAMANQGLLHACNYKEEQETHLSSVKDANFTLRQQLDELELLTRQHNTLEKHVQEKDLECVTLKEKLKLKSEVCLDLVTRIYK